jgi:hypothetical protein
MADQKACVRLTTDAFCNNSSQSLASILRDYCAAEVAISYNTPHSKVLKIFEKSPSIRSVTVYDLSSELLWYVAPILRGRRHVALSATDSKKYDPKIKGCRISDWTLAEIRRAFSADARVSGEPALKSLNMSGFKNGLDVVSAVIESGAPQLSRFALVGSDLRSRCDPTATPHSCLADLARFSLVSLNLSYSQLDDSAIAHLSRGFTGHPTLRRLDLSNSRVISANGAAFCERICDIICGRSPGDEAPDTSGGVLSEVDLRGVAFGGEGTIRLIAAACSEPSQVRTLLLTPTGEAGAVAVRDALRDNPRIVSFGHWNGFGELSEEIKMHSKRNSDWNEGRVTKAAS